MSSAHYTRLDDPTSDVKSDQHAISINQPSSNGHTTTTIPATSTSTSTSTSKKPSTFAGRGFRVNPNAKENRSLYKAEIDESIHDTQKDRNRKPLTFRRLFQQAKPERPMLIIATIALFFSALFNLAVPAFVGVIIDAIADANSLNPSHDRSNDLINRFVRDLGFGDTPKVLLNVSVIILAILITVAAFFSSVRGYLFSLAGERVVARIRNQLFQHIMHFEIAFFDITRTGELVNRLSSDTTILKDAVTSNVSMGLRWGATVLVGIGYLFFISWKLTLVMLSVVPVVAIAARLYGKKIRTLSKQTQEALARATETAEESISHIRTVRAFYREPLQTSLYGDRIQTTYDLGATIALYYGLFLGGIGWVASAAMILVLWYGATLVLNHDLSPGVLTSYVLYTITVGAALAGLSGLFGSIMQAVGACDRVFELLDRQPAINVKGGHIPPQLIGHVSFQNVSFAYPSRPQTLVLRNVNLELKPGTVTALVGQSGGGKSTCVSLIERFYDVAEGNGVINIDGRNIKSLDPSWLHQHIGLVSQEPVLFATTIRENLTYGGMLNVTDADIDRACEMANAANFINLFPEKYETMVGERGIRLSGGQKQRVAIARAILMNPSILIADEATSSLDAESEYHVQTALDRLMQGRTVLVVAHRLSTVKNADNVVVIDGGRIVEQGTHTQLLARSGTYAKLVARQLTQSLPEPEAAETSTDTSSSLSTFTATSSSTSI